VVTTVTKDEINKRRKGRMSCWHQVVTVHDSVTASTFFNYILQTHNINLTSEAICYFPSLGDYVEAIVYY